MDPQLILLITSLCLNGLMIVRDFTKRIRKSECWGSKLELDRESSSPTTATTATPSSAIV